MHWNAHEAVEAWLRRKYKLPLTLRHVGILTALTLGYDRPMRHGSVQFAERRALEKIKHALAHAYADGELPKRVEQVSDYQRENGQRNRNNKIGVGLTAERRTACPSTRTLR